MSCLKAHLDYILKHNQFISKLFRVTASFFFRTVGCFVKTDEKAILFSGLNQQYNDSPRSIYEKIIHNPKFKDYKCYWAVAKPNETDIPGKCIKVKADTWKYFMTAMKCKYWIACVNVERSLRFKKDECIYLNTWHGTPFKTIGNTAVGRKDFDFSYINYVCVSGTYEKELFIKAFNVSPEQMLFTGLPRNDELYRVTKEDAKNLRKKLNISEHKKVILYAPTWRDSNDGGKTYALKPPVNIAYWKQKLGDEFIVLMRTHPYTNKLLGIKFDDFVRDYSSYPKINDLMIVADYMVSDYSSAMFDFSILEKPMFCYGYDYDSYKNDRAFALDPQMALVNGVIKTEEELLEKIKTCNYKEECNNTKDFKHKYFEYGGKATDICINNVFNLKQ